MNLLFVFKKYKLVWLATGLGGGVGLVFGTFLALTQDLPQIRTLGSYEPSAITRVYSSDKVLLAELSVEKRVPVPLKQIPDYLVQALVATEDRQFYNHSGVDIKGIARAIIKDVLAGEFVEGASTLTQQLAKTLFLSSKKTITRKIKEAIIAFQLERKFTKNEILQFYLNQVYLGSGAYGVQSAASIYFGKKLSELTLAECALIAGMPKAPSAYSPLSNKQLALKRRNIVLKQMLYTHIINEKDYLKALNEPLNLAGRLKLEVKAPYFVQYLKKGLAEVVDVHLIYHGGLTIDTTLSYRLQEASEIAVQKGLAQLTKRMRRNGIKEATPQCALVVLDIRTGGILALVGGDDFEKTPFNRATQALRQPGSAFKPFVYALAIEKGFQQNKLLLDAPVSYQIGPQGKLWEPENFSHDFSGEMTMRKALALSKNIPAIRLIEMLGPDSTAQFAQTFGIKSKLNPTLSLALGTSEMTLLELTSAYTVFANQGIHIAPQSIREVIDRKGGVLYREKPQKKEVLTRASAAIVTDMLRAVMKEGTGKRARHLYPALAGKTGTTNAYKDALFVGFTPTVAVGVWVGRDDNLTLGKWETGAKAALPIWTECMRAVLEGSPAYQYFDIPDNVRQARMDPETGDLLDDMTEKGVTVLLKKKAFH